MRSRLILALGIALFLALSPCIAADLGDTNVSVRAPSPNKNNDAEEVSPASPSDIKLPSPLSEPPPAGVDPSPMPAAPCDCPLRPQDQFWVIETGHLPWVDCQGFAAPNLGISRFQCGSGFVTTSLAEFLALAQNTNTVFYVPGNRVADGEAVRRGWMIYNTLAAASDDRPLRLVVWSWPSERVRGVLRDIRLKADRTTTEGLYLGWLLTQFDPQAQVSLHGFSFGCRVVCGALQAVQAGSLEGIAIPDYVASEERQPVRVVAMAAAAHNYWLLPGQTHGAAIARIDRMLLCFNSCDIALKHYQMIDKCERPAALGYTGFVGTGALGEAANRLRQLDVCCMVGKEHAELNYYCNPSIMAEAARYLLWRNIEE